MTNILFICKFNRFRSKVAEAYFKKINKNPKNQAKSAGLIVGTALNRHQKARAREFGIKLTGRPKPLTAELLVWADFFVIVKIHEVHCSFVSLVISVKIIDLEKFSFQY